MSIEIKTHTKKAYSEYKDSGVEWLNKIPKHWKVTSVNKIYNIQLGKMLQPEASSADDIHISYLKALHIQWGDIKFYNYLPKMWMNRAELFKYEVQNGDLLICEGGEVGRCAIVTGLEEQTIIQNSLHRARSTQTANNNYLFYFMHHTEQSGWLNVLCNRATIAHLTSEKLGALPIPLPNLDEQYKISGFLDFHTTKIDTLINKNYSLIELLKEKRQALITETVTKGLDHDVEMKDSGVEWIGEIPSHWEVKPIKYVADINKNTLSESTKFKDSIHYIEINNVSSSGVIREINEMNIEDAPSRAKRILNYGDTLVSTVRTYLRAITFIDFHKNNLIGSTGFTVITTKNDSNLFWRFLGYYCRINGFIENIVASSVGVSYPAINSSAIGNMPIVIPTISEQEAIEIFLRKETSKIDQLMDKTEKMIEYLQEYRQSLITEVVTGKIDVRDEPEAMMEPHETERNEGE